MNSASIENTGDQQYRASVKDYSFVMGQGGGNPVDVLLASLCACVGHHVRDYLVEQGIAYSAFTAKAEAARSDDRRRLTRIALTFDLGGSRLSEAQKSGLLRQADLCPVYNALAKAAPIDLAIR